MQEKYVFLSKEEFAVAWCIIESWNFLSIIYSHAGVK